MEYKKDGESLVIEDVIVHKIPREQLLAERKRIDNLLAKLDELDAMEEAEKNKKV